MCEIVGQPDMRSPSIIAVRLADEKSSIAEALQQALRRRRREPRGDTGGAGRDGSALGLMYEQVEQYVPGRLSETFFCTHELAPEQSAASGSARIG